MMLAGGFRHVPVPQSRPLLRLQRPLIEPYVTFSVIRLSESLPPAAFSTGAQCAPPKHRGPPVARRRGAFARTPDACADVCPAASVEACSGHICRHRRDARNDSFAVSAHGKAFSAAPPAAAIA